MIISTVGEKAKAFVPSMLPPEPPVDWSPRCVKNSTRHCWPFYSLLNAVRMTGDWEPWLDFFSHAVVCTATQAVDTAQLMMKHDI